MNQHFLVPRLTTRSARPARSITLGDFDRVFDEFWRNAGSAAANVATPATLTPRMDTRETESEIVVAAELPGLSEADISVSLEEGVLTIEGKRAEESREAREEGFVHVETFRGDFRRAVRLNREVDADAVRAVYKSGVLTVTLPKVPEVKPEVRTIAVTTD